MYVRNVGKTKNYKTHFCALINHAERGDYVKGFKYDVQDVLDPPITPKGMV